VSDQPDSSWHKQDTAGWLRVKNASSDVRCSQVRTLILILIYADKYILIPPGTSGKVLLFKE
jgi:hypothetical protein